ncbi:MAG: ATP-dependent DNA helicase, partial [Muribaculaceae bacterium]|nr:ATP-dependent DNA helicase [Muribaculaceae bacterium]
MTPAEETLKKYYGYSTFRPGQKEIIEQVSSGRDALVLMPTGGGKSLCYQIPALMLPGCAIVVSPLIALMNDQVEALCANGIPAAAIHSNRDEYANRELLYAASQGKLKLLYISPERLMLELDNIVERLPVSLIAIDEAHCISQWGHDFRPVYTQLSVLKQRFPNVPVMALTATADRLTREDIAHALGLDNPFVYIGSFDRPNISLRVMNDPGKKQRLRIIGSLIDKYHLDSGIVYCLSRKKTEAMHEALTEMGYKSVCYHAGLLPQEREAAQRAFVNGEAQVVCATIAFGMGIDKSNIRWVVHNNIPGNIESYYQEIGRAGRDGLPAETLMFYNFSDIITRRSFVDESGRRDINNEKLDFMQRYAEATVCRRRILLSYFSE